LFFQPRAASDSGPIDRLAIVSWNIHEGGGDVEDLIRRLRGGEFTGGEPIDHFVLLLQEATRRDDSVPPRAAHGYPIPRAILSHPASRDADVHRYADRGFAVLYAPSMRNGAGPEDRGNAIVSTLQLTNSRLIELPLEHQRRVSTAAAVEGRTTGGRSWRLDLVNVHLDTALALGRGGPFAARRRQVAALLDALPSPRQFDGEQALVVAGDFNTWMGDGEAAIQLLREAFPNTPAADREPTWRGPLGLHATLDHVFVRGAVSASRVVRLPNRFGSDHFPLLTIVRF
jgi:endonuclease/exonuclease/phosphatase family metal-dependent hydrolase